MDQLSEQFQHATFAFLEWFTATDGTRLNSRVELADLRGSAAGRGAGKQRPLRKCKAMLTMVCSSRQSKYCRR